MEIWSTQRLRIQHRAKLLVYDGVGHAVHQDAAQRFGRDLSEFVRATRAGQQ